MILLIDDQTWRQMTSVLVATDAGRALAERLNAVPELPEDRELVRMARAGDPPPKAVERARLRRERAIEASQTTRSELADLLLHVHGAGVPVATLSRWFGLKQTRIYEIIGGANA